MNESQVLADIAQSKEFFLLIRSFGVKPWFFSNPLHRDIFKTLLSSIDMNGYGSHVPPILGSGLDIGRSLRELLSTNTDLTCREKCTGEGQLEVLGMLADHRKCRFDYVANQLLEKIKRCIEQGEPYQAELSKFSEFTNEAVNDDLMDMGEVLDQMQIDDNPIVSKFNIPPLDEFVKLRSSCLLVLAGESSSGKTTLANQVAWQMVLKSERKCLYFSTETVQRRMGWRMVQHVKSSSGLSDDDCKRVMREKSGQMTITSTTNELGAILRTIREQHKNEGLSMVIIDYVQNVRVDGSSNNLERAEAVIMGVHEICVELNLLMVALCQLTKENLPVSNGRKVDRPPPTMNSLRGAAQLSNSADIIIVNQFPDIAATNASARNVNLFVVKNKDGRQGKAECLMLGKEFTFVEA